MNFEHYPLDSHNCLLDLKSWDGALYRLVLNSPKIFTFAKDGKTEIEGEKLVKNNTDRLDYNFVFKPLNSTVFYDDGYEYSLTQLELGFSRTKKSQNQIFGGYYTSMAIFAILSQISYFINPDIVPGRMGMLIMLYLIQINTYASLKAPDKRGFSSIEV